MRNPITAKQVYNLLALLTVLVLALVVLNGFWPGILFQTTSSSPGDRREGIVFRSSVRVVTSSDSPVAVISTDRVIYADASAGNIVLDLPPTGDLRGLRVTIKKIDSSVNTVSVDPFGSETIDRQITAFVLNQQDETLTVLGDGDEWHVVEFSTWISDRVTTTSVTNVINIPALSVTPATCNTGDLYINTDGGGTLCVCTGGNDWMRANTAGSCG